MRNRTEDSSQALSVEACGSQIGPDFFVMQHQTEHTPNIAFRHLPPNSARFGYATEGALDLYLRVAVHRRGQRPSKGSGTNMTVEAT